MSEALIESANSLADGATPPLTHSRHQLILANAPSTPQISLPSRSGHTALQCCDFSGPNTIFRTQIIHLHFGDCLQWNFVLLAVKCHGVSPLSIAAVNLSIARDDPHSKCINCLGFSNAREAVYGISKCTFCENLRLITLRSRLEACEKESSIFPRRAPEASAASRESTTWGSDVELEEMESEQTGLAFSLPPSPERVREFTGC